jgi:hypothetical protein
MLQGAAGPRAWQSTTWPSGRGTFATGPGGCHWRVAGAAGESACHWRFASGAGELQGGKRKAESEDGVPPFASSFPVSAGGCLTTARQHDPTSSPPSASPTAARRSLRAAGRAETWARDASDLLAMSVSSVSPAYSKVASPGRTSAPSGRRVGHGTCPAAGKAVSAAWLPPVWPAGLSAAPQRASWPGVG